MLVILQLYVLCVIKKKSPYLLLSLPSPPSSLSSLSLSCLFVVNVRAGSVTQSDMISVSDITAEADREPGVWMEGRGVRMRSHFKEPKGKEASILSETPLDCTAAYKHPGFSLIYPISPSP